MFHVFWYKRGMGLTPERINLGDLTIGAIMDSGHHHEIASRKPVVKVGTWFCIINKDVLLVIHGSGQLGHRSMSGTCINIPLKDGYPLWAGQNPTPFINVSVLCSTLPSSSADNVGHLWLQAVSLRSCSQTCLISMKIHLSFLGRWSSDCLNTYLNFTTHGMNPAKTWHRNTYPTYTFPSTNTSHSLPKTVFVCLRRHFEGSRLDDLELYNWVPGIQILVAPNTPDTTGDGNQGKSRSKMNDSFPTKVAIIYL